MCVAGGTIRPARFQLDGLCFRPRHPVGAFGRPNGIDVVHRSGALLGACRPHDARRRAAAALPELRRNRRDGGRSLRRLLAGLRLHRAALLRALCLSLRPAGWRGCAVRRLRGAAAALSAGACRPGLRRQEPQAGAAVQAWRPYRHRPRLRCLDGARRRRLAGRRRPGGAGAAALAPAVHAALQPGPAPGPHRRRGGAIDARRGWSPT